MSNVNLQQRLNDLFGHIRQGKIKISPALPPEQLGSCSVDFRLGSEFSVFEHSRHAFIDLRDKTSIQDLMRPITVPSGEPLYMQPGEFALAILPDGFEDNEGGFGSVVVAPGGSPG